LDAAGRRGGAPSPSPPYADDVHAHLRVPPLPRQRQLGAATMNTKVIAVVLVVALVASGISTALFVLLG
jgi:hypothetical protein